MPKRLNAMYPKMYKYRPWEKKRRPLWQDIASEGTQSPRQHNAFTMTSIFRKKKYAWGELQSFLLTFLHFIPLKIRYSANSFNSYIVRPNNSLAPLVKITPKAQEVRGSWRLGLLCSMDVHVICSAGRLEQLHHGGTRRHAVTHTVKCMMWTLASTEWKTTLTRINKPQPWLLTISHLNIHVLPTKFSQLKRPKHVPCAWLP